MSKIIQIQTVLMALMLAGCAAPSVMTAPGARLERLDIVSRAPAFGGKLFDDVGAYETITAIAHLQIDPEHASNRFIVDLDLAPRRRGWVDYQTNVVILRPVDAAKASRVLLVDLPNRGSKMFLRMANEGSGDVDKAADAGNGFLMRRGHTVAWIGWQGDIGLARDAGPVGTRLPTASAKGKSIVGRSRQEVVFDTLQPVSTVALAYPAASLDQARATLSVRANAASAATVLAPAAWRYTSPGQIEITRPRGFDAGAIYRFDYDARDPLVMGLGMAAVRDVASFLQSSVPGRAGQANPIADIAPDVTLAVGVSQSGRFLRDLLWQGFNADTRGGRVFDGAMPLIAGSRKSFVNARFAQPGRYSTQHVDHLTYGDQFPFSYGVTTDPVSGKTDGIFSRCEASATCPRLMHVDSSTEFWQGRASLVVTDGAGADIALPPGVRAYLMSSTQHMSDRVPSVGVCKHLSNPAEQGATVRALLERLVIWTRSGKEPPPSRFPQHATAMLTPPQRDAVGFPDLRALGIGYPDVINTLDVVHYDGGLARPDPALRYQVLVPMADVDGHDIAGIRLPDIEVPLATHAGWNLRRNAFAEGQLCGLNGLSVPLPATARTGDPRRAIGQRYTSRLEYAKAVALAARALRDQGLLLDDDVERYIERAKREQRVAP